MRSSRPWPTISIGIIACLGRGLTLASGAPHLPEQSLSESPATSVAQFHSSQKLLITDLHAAGDGKTLNTAAIQSAIDQLAVQGGGTVVVPEGVFVCGALFFKPGVNLYLEKGAVLQCSTDIVNFPEQPTWIEGHLEPSFNTGLINARGCDGFRLTGSGTLDGNGRPIWDLFWKLRNATKDHRSFRNLSVHRAQLAIISDCKNVVIEGVTFKDSQFWNLHLYGCENALVKNTRFLVPDDYKQAPSTDGIDIDSSRNVTVERCFFSVTDDCIALKGPKGPDAPQNKNGGPTEHIRVTGCTFVRGAGAVTLGSEASTVRDVVLEDSHVLGSMPVLQCKLRPDTPQCYEGVRVDNITVDNPNGMILKIAPWLQYADLKGQPPPKSVVQHLYISNIKGRTKSLALIQPNPGQTTIGDIHFNDVEIALQNDRPTISGAVREVEFKHVIANGKPMQPMLSPVSK